MLIRPPLSSTATGEAWLSQFAVEDRRAAARLLDAMMLINEEQVATALRSLLADLATTRWGSHKRVALYAEREIAEAMAFRVELLPDKHGRLRRRAVGRKGPAAVKPIRGSPRVGSEGWIAFLISQVVRASPKVFLNHPGPDRFRSRKQPVGTLAIVTDFIGSGARVCTMLDKFWAVPSVRSWCSRGWVNFNVVAAASTREGLQAVRNHRVRPELLVQYIAPQLAGHKYDPAYRYWRSLIENYGPEHAAGGGREGFGNSGALIAFSYGIPNNAPLILHAGGKGWQPLFKGPIPLDLRKAFGLQSDEERIANAVEATGVVLAADLSVLDSQMVIFLSGTRGRWRPGAQTAMAELTGLTEPEVLATLKRASAQGYLDINGRLTDAGRAVLYAAQWREAERPTIPTNAKPYYPLQLRTPRGSSSTSRPSGRPR
jgi:hypothetical protein